jgi:hypothetical protein
VGAGMVTVEIDGIARAIKMCDWYTNRELHNRMRRAVRAGGKEMQAALKVAAAEEPTGNLPDSFKKVLAPKVSASARRGGDIVATVRPKSPLFNIFEPGAGQHEIDAPLLAGPAGDGSWSAAGRKRSGEFFAHGSVRHPGMKARPIRPTAFAAGRRPAEDAIAKVLFEQAP